MEEILTKYEYSSDHNQYVINADIDEQILTFKDRLKQRSNHFYLIIVIRKSEEKCFNTKRVLEIDKESLIKYIQDSIIK
jgi:hypothetical protein